MFALDLSGLKRADVTFWGAWEGEMLLGFVVTLVCTGTLQWMIKRTYLGKAIRATVQDGGGSYSDALHVWSAPDLRGPWTPHRRNPPR